MGLTTRRSNPVLDAADLAAGKYAARAMLAAGAEAARQQYITPGDGKAAVYRQKREEAAAWQAIVDAAGTPVPADYPFLKARAERLNAGAPDYQAVADEWNAKAAAWLVAGPAIEDVYEAAVEAVDTAADLAAVCAATRVSWPGPA